MEKDFANKGELLGRQLNESKPTKRRVKNSLYRLGVTLALAGLIGIPLCRNYIKQMPAIDEVENADCLGELRKFPNSLEAFIPGYQGIDSKSDGEWDSISRMDGTIVPQNSIEFDYVANKLNKLVSCKKK